MKLTDDAKAIRRACLNGKITRAEAEVATGKRGGNLDRTLKQMCEAGLLIRAGHGIYKHPRHDDRAAAK